MEIKLVRCNNIDEGIITLNEKQLNIKYAINGTGKSTISSALLSFITDKQNGTSELLALTPFKHIDKVGMQPELIGADSINSVRVFDEKYISEFIFQPNELLKGSFDVFICDQDYKKGMKEIDVLVETIREELAKDRSVEDLIKDFNELSSGFGKPTNKGIHASSALSKAFKDGNKIANIPNGLEEFKDFIQNSNNYKWIKWQIDGKPFIDISENCPYCVSGIKEKKHKIKRVSEVYDSKSVDNLNKIVSVFQRLNKYFSDETNAVIDSFVKNIEAYTTDQVNYLREVRDQVDRLYNKIVNAQSLGFRSFKDVDKVLEGLRNHYIDLKLFGHLNSESTRSKIDIINNSLDVIIKKAGELQGSINKQKKLIEKLVEENKKEINGFLKNAGYKYSVDLIESDDGQLRLQLVHDDIKDIVSNVKTHLSFGEKNAFSLVLFMYDAIKNGPDIIVLDDPISSFDKNKKYAIIDMLFRKEKFFKGKTVLLLTHDFEPIVDMVLHHTDKFALPHAVFLENVNGVLFEKEIQKADIKTFIEINKANASSDINILNRIVYLRRLYEIMAEKNHAYQLISNLLHKREKATITEEMATRPMTTNEIMSGVEQIKETIADFDYNSVLAIVKDDDQMKKLYFSAANNYEKLHIYRIIYDDKPEVIESTIIQKFINEAFHIENDYIYQLNPRDYQLVPQYIIDECDKYVGASD